VCGYYLIISCCNQLLEDFRNCILISNTAFLTKGRYQGLLTNQIGLELHGLRIGTGTDLLGHPLLQTRQFFNSNCANRLNLVQTTALASLEEAATEEAGRRNSDPY